ncbi:MAG TPA: SAF domain-containing protein [Solirubrobacterales bacterium]|nr:SAF domain-containing protein [Solirubrobacterales bacterium]
MVASAVAAAIADGYGASVARGYGPLRPVVVAAQALEGGEPLRPADLSEALELRRVPARFVPPGALAAPGEALGLVPLAAVPAGAYLIAAQLRPPRQGGAASTVLGTRRHPVEIAVSGAEALLATGSAASGAKVDVVVTTEPRGGGSGRTYVAAAGVPLLALGPGADGPGPGGASAATLGLTKPQALRLIAAESFARKLTLLPRG